MPPTSSHKKEIAVGAAMVVVVIGLLGIVIFANKKSSKVATCQATKSTVAKPAATTAADTYKNGTYSATGSYDSPGGTESITVSVTVQNGVVTATSATSGATDS